MSAFRKEIHPTNSTPRSEMALPRMLSRGRNIGLDRVTKLPKWLTVVWVGLATVILGADYFTGPSVSFSIALVVPVALASRLSGCWWGTALGVLLPIARFGVTFLDTAGSRVGSLVSAGIEAAVLVAFAVLIDRVTRQAREIRVLHGLLPVCGFCKKIRTEDQRWQPIESYITERSEASFTHTFCPECGKQHYGEYVEKIAARQSAASQDALKQQ
jgi:hypothetical protein